MMLDNLQITLHGTDDLPFVRLDMYNFHYITEDWSPNISHMFVGGDDITITDLNPTHTVISGTDGKSDLDKYFSATILRRRRGDVAKLSSPTPVGGVGGVGTGKLTPGMVGSAIYGAKAHRSTPHYRAIQSSVGTIPPVSPSASTASPTMKKNPRLSFMKKRPSSSGSSPKTPRKQTSRVSVDASSPIQAHIDSEIPKKELFNITYSKRYPVVPIGNISPDFSESNIFRGRTCAACCPSEVGR